MPGQDKSLFSILVSAVTLILLEVAALSMLSHSRSLHDAWIGRASHGVSGFLWSHGESIRYYMSLSGQNEALSKENFALSEELRKLKEAEAAGVPMSISGPGCRFECIPATVIKLSRNTQHNYFVLNKGKEDGVVPESGVITSHGVVGIINAVSARYSYGMTFMNTVVNVSARVGRDGVVAPLSWDGKRKDGAILREVPLHIQINPGDTVWTSGFSTLFPADVPLGTTGKVRTVYGSTNEVEVKLFQDFSSLRFVTIAVNPDREEIAGLEKGGER